MGVTKFAVLLPDADLQLPNRLFQVSQAVLKVIAGHGWPSHERRVAVFERAPATVDDAIRAADTVMYRVKAQGKNKILYELTNLHDGMNERVVGKSGRANQE